MYFSIERKTGKTVQLMGEDKKPLEVPAEMVPEGTREGDMLLYENGKFTYAPDKTTERRERVSGMLSLLLGGKLDDEDGE